MKRINNLLQLACSITLLLFILSSNRCYMICGSSGSILYEQSFLQFSPFQDFRPILSRYNVTMEFPNDTIFSMDFFPCDLARRAA